MFIIMDTTIQSDPVITILTDQVDSRTRKSRSNKTNYSETIQKYRKVAKEIVLTLFIVFMIYSSLKGENINTEAKLSQIMKVLEGDLSILALSADVPRVQKLTQEKNNFKVYNNPEWISTSTKSPKQTLTDN